MQNSGGTVTPTTFEPESQKCGPNEGTARRRWALDGEASNSKAATARITRGSRIPGICEVYIDAAAAALRRSSNRSEDLISDLDLQDLPEADRRRTEADVRDVEVSVRPERHRRR